jgi:hypothetical protein
LLNDILPVGAGRDATKNTNRKSLDHVKAFLVKPRYYTRIHEYSSKLISYFTDYKTSEESCVILGQLDLPKDVIDELLISEITPAKVKARLGDQSSTETVLMKFTTAYSLASKRTYAYDLLYVNNEQTLKEYFTAMESQEVFTNYRSEKISLTLVMIQTYGEVNPDTSLFSPKEYQNYCYTTENEFKKEKYQAYLRRIEKYFFDKYGVELNINPPFLILGDYKETEYLKKVHQ